MADDKSLAYEGGNYICGERKGLLFKLLHYQDDIMPAEAEGV